MALLACACRDAPQAVSYAYDATLTERLTPYDPAWPNACERTPDERIGLPPELSRERSPRLVSPAFVADLSAAIDSLPAPLDRLFERHVCAVVLMHGAPMSGTLIVCVENDRAILDGMRTLLTGWDAKVIAAVDPATAADAIAASGERVTGLLVDYHLDRGNGIAAIRDIRQKFGPSIPAILITADRSPHVRDAAREENIVVMNKPLKPAVLRSMMARVRPLAPAAG